MVPPSADTTKRLVTPRGPGSPRDPQVRIQPAGHIGQNRLRVEVRKQSVIRSGVLSEFPVWLAQPGEEFPAPIRRHHSVRRSMQEEQRDREGFRLTLHPGNSGGHFGREPCGPPPVKQGIRENCLDDGWIPGQSAQVHSHPQRETGC